MGTKTTDRKPGHLTLVKGGKGPDPDFAPLPFPEKLALLRQAGPARQRELILGDPEGKRLVRGLLPLEFFWLATETGAADTHHLLQMASPEQISLLMDLELWDGWELSPERCAEWLDQIVEGGEELVAELLPSLDLELLILTLQREIGVAGGLNLLTSDEERLGNWDHTFDDIYFITFKNPKRSRVVGTFLDLLFRLDHRLYLALMEGIRHELESELTELAWQFRNGRLAELGFPPREEALGIYAWLDPETFVPASAGKDFVTAPDEQVPALPISSDSFLQRVLTRAAAPELLLEMNYLITGALVAEGIPSGDREALSAVLQRVNGCLTIALEILSGGDEAVAADLVRREYLKQLFRFGYARLTSLARKAKGIVPIDHPTERVLAGLAATRPRYYRGLDPDAADGFREFRDLEDLRRMEELVAGLAG